MAVKYRRETLSGPQGAPSNRYEIRPGQSGAPARRRLLYLYVAIVVLAAASLVVHFLSENRINRWLPERPGQAVVEEKISGDPGTRPRYQLRVRVLVPPATPEEAALLPEDHPDRDEALGPQELYDEIETPEADWAAVEPGTPLRASYQINIPRTKIVVRSLYLDHLNSGTAGAPERATLPPQVPAP